MSHRSKDQKMKLKLATVIRVPAIQAHEGISLRKAWKIAEKPVREAVDAIVKDLQQSGKLKFTDHDFGPNKKDPDGVFAFYKDGLFRPPYPDPKFCTWIRPKYSESSDYTSNDEESEVSQEELDTEYQASYADYYCPEGELFKDGARSNDCVQGNLGDCWFIGALSVLATRHDLLKKLFWGCSDPKLNSMLQQHGMRVCRFFKDFEWYYVIIDDCIPVFANSLKPVFAHCRDLNELWVSFAEKAYAKLHGSYDSLIGGYIDGALRDLTGLIGQELVLRPGHQGFHPQNKIDLDNDTLWRKIDKYINEWGCMMGCSIQPDPVPKGQKNPPAEQQIGDTGLLLRHAYAIVDVGEITVDSEKIRLVRLRNPWGFAEWTGPWADQSEELRNNFDKINAEFAGPIHRYSKGPRNRRYAKGDYHTYADSDTDVETVELNERDGTFFMRWEDWKRYFTVIFAAVDFPDDWQGQRICGEWLGGLSSGGNITKRTWKTNPRFGFEIFEPATSCFISLSQDDPRRKEGRNQSKCQDPIGFHIILDGQQEKIPVDDPYIPGCEPAKVQCVYKLHLNVEVEVTLRPGRYFIVPSTYYEDRPGPFFINFYSDKPIAVQNASLIAEEEEESGSHQVKEYVNNDSSLNSAVSPREFEAARRFEFERNKFVETLRKMKVSMKHAVDIFKQSSNNVNYDEWRSKLSTIGLPKDALTHDQFMSLAGDDGLLDASELRRIFEAEVEADMIFGRMTTLVGDEFRPLSQPEENETDLVGNNSMKGTIAVWNQRMSYLEEENLLFREEIERMKEEQARIMHVLLLYGKMLKCYDGEVFSPDDLKNNRALNRQRLSDAKSPISTEMSFGEVADGDEFLAVKPWKGSIFPPSNLVLPIDTSMPDTSFDLEWVYGYQSKTSRNNLKYNSEGLIVYHTAAVGIILDVSARQQRFHVGHGDDITCLAISDDGKLVATGQMGKQPRCRVWSAISGDLLSESNTFHSRAISQVAFVKVRKLLVTVGNDNDHSIAVYSGEETNWRSLSLVATSKGDKNPCLFAIGTAHEQSPFVTGGVNHIYFWHCDPESGSKMKIKARRGKFGKEGGEAQPLPCAISVESMNETLVITGSASGKLLVWRGDRCFSSNDNGHNGAVNALTKNDFQGVNYVISGGKDGNVNLWVLREGILEKLNTFSLLTINRSGGKILNPCIRALCWSKELGKLLIGTLGSEIIEISDLTTSKFSPEAYQLIYQGHFDGELWGLATHPSKPNLFATSGDDRTVRLWDSNTKSMVAMTKLRDSSRTLDWSPDGKSIACGLGARTGRNGSRDSPGGIVILDGNNLKSKNKEDFQSIKKWVSDIKYSPNGKFIGVASHDSKVWLYESKTLKRSKHKCARSSSAVTHFDWSEDSAYIQTNDLSYELLFYESRTGRQIQKAASLRDVRWSTFTSPLGWPTEGIWPSFADGTDINSVARSNSHRLLASGDDFGNVKLFRYPYPKTAKPHFKVGKGHSSHVTCTRFNCSDDILFSTGGNDRSIFQWRLKR